MTCNGNMSCFCANISSQFNHVMDLKQNTNNLSSNHGYNSSRPHLVKHQTTPQKITLRRRCRSESTQFGIGAGSGVIESSNSSYNYHIRNNMKTKSELQQPKLHIDVVSLNTARKTLADTRSAILTNGNGNIKEHTKENIVHNEPEIMDLKEVYLNEIKYSNNMHNSSNLKTIPKSKITETAFNPKESIFDSNKRRIRARSESEPQELYTNPVRGLHYIEKIRDEISQKRPRNAPSPTTESKVSGVLRKEASSLSTRISNPHHANMMTRSVRGSRSKTPVVVANIRSKVRIRPTTPLSTKNYKNSSSSTSPADLSSTDLLKANNKEDVTACESDRLSKNCSNINLDDDLEDLKIRNNKTIDKTVTPCKIAVKKASMDDNCKVNVADNDDDDLDDKDVNDERDDDDDDDEDDDDDDDDDLENDSINDEEIDGYATDPEDNYKSYLASYSSDKSLLAPIITLESVPGGKPTTNKPLAPSLFPHVPPYITFATHVQKGAIMPPDLTKILKWKLTTITPIVVRKVLMNSGFRLLKKTNDWMGTWGKHMKSPCFKTLRSYQKFNHIPGSFQIGRKDRVWRNLQALMVKHGKKEFGFMPRTFIIPQDLKLLRQVWPRYSQRNVKWIIKPPAAARGTGIKVVNRWSQIPKRKPLIVQRYIDRPMLINESKFDLRLYVLVTSVNPLRIYMHTDGLARFASVKYSDRSDTLNDRYMHLTNYSINKLSMNYDKNEDANACKGHKWTIKSLWQYLAEERKINTDRLWGALRNLVIRTILSAESPIYSMTKLNIGSKYNCYELFGIDVILDSELIPWLLEVNISPSLHSASPLDLHVKGPLVTAILNTALYQVPPKISPQEQVEILQNLKLHGSPLCYDKRIFCMGLNKVERQKHNQFIQRNSSRSEYLDSILSDLTPDDVRCLLLTEDELARSSPLERIFPTKNTHKYLTFTDSPRYYNRLLDAYENRYSKNRAEGIALIQTYCERKVHLQVPPPTIVTDCNNRLHNSETEQQNDTSSLNDGSTLSTKYGSSDSVASSFVVNNNKQPPQIFQHQHTSITNPETTRNSSNDASHLLINDLILSKKHDLNKITAKTKLQQQGDVNVATVLSVKH